MQFEYLAAPQRSPEWYKARLGKVTASRLCDWLAVSRAKAGAGKPLKARLDYEKELMFERQFGVSFENYVTDAMQDGIDYESYAAIQYAISHPDYIIEECGCWYNDYFVASPDRVVLVKKREHPEQPVDRIETLPTHEAEGLLEIKIVRDNTFTEILASGVPDKHLKQIQGQLFASGKKWCDYLALNFNTKKYVIIRVEPDQEFFDYLELALQEQLVTEPFALDKVHDVVGDLPQGVLVGAVDRNNNPTGGW